MQGFAQKTLFLLIALSVAAAPMAAEASFLPVQTCAPMMQGAQKDSCCGSHCDCAVETESPDLSFISPASTPRFELSGETLLNTVSTTRVEPVSQERPAAESPPSTDPLYQLYSDYRL